MVIYCIFPPTIDCFLTISFTGYSQNLSIILITKINLKF